MMNEDRFNSRAWDVKRKIMINSEEYATSFGGYAIHVNCDGEYAYVNDQLDHLILMQCTGLKDKNDMLIFEGDILEMVRDVQTSVSRHRKYKSREMQTFPIRSELTFNGVVKIGHFKTTFYDCGMVAYVETDFSTEHDSYFMGGNKPRRVSTKNSEVLQVDREYEIKGDIYRNPELLEAS